MEPYVPNDEPLLEEDSKHKKKDKKKKKSKKAAEIVQTSSDPYVQTSGVEMTGAVSKKPKSEKKPKSSRKPKSEKKPKKSSKNKSGGGGAYVDEMHATTMAKPVSVLEDSGFAPLNPKEINARHAHGSTSEFQYAITGHESQVVAVSIPPGEECQGEPGSMMYLTNNVKMSTTCSGGACGRCMAGESCCLLTFTNTGGEPGFAGLTMEQPLAKVVPVHMDDPSVGGSLIVQSGTYMAHYGDVKITFSCDWNICRCLCGGMGLVRQNLKGTGVAFLGATGTIVQKVLEDGEVMLCDTNCLLAYAESCKFDIKRTGGLVGMFGGGEGIFNASVTGPGLVVVQSMSMCLLLQSLAAEKMWRR